MREQGKRQIRISFANRLTGPWRRFVRIRAMSRSQLATAWQQPPAPCRREAQGTG